MCISIDGELSRDRSMSTSFHFVFSPIKIFLTRRTSSKFLSLGHKLVFILVVQEYSSWLKLSFQSEYNPLFQQLMFAVLLKEMSWFNLLKQELIFSTQFLLKIPVFELNNHLVFHWTWAVDMQSIIELLQLIHNFLTSGNKVRSSVRIFLVVSNRDVSSWPNG